MEATNDFLVRRIGTGISSSSDELLEVSEESNLGFLGGCSSSQLLVQVLSSSASSSETPSC